MKRREILKLATLAGLCTVGSAPVLGRPSAAGMRRVLYFTRSAGFEHSVVQRRAALLSHSESLLIEIGRKAGFDVECTKDGRVFDGGLDAYDVIAFYTSGDLTQPAKDGSPAMTPQGKRRWSGHRKGGWHCRDYSIFATSQNSRPGP